MYKSKMAKHSEPKKGQASKTMKGKEDFTTKKTSKDFDRGGKREQTAEGSDAQKKALNKHLDDAGMTGKERTSHRMKMMARMRKGMSVAAAHKDIMK
jgi:hypothetical protein